MMKQSYLLTAILVLGIASCTKEADVLVTGDSNGQSGQEVPASATSGIVQIKFEKPLEELIADGLDLSSVLGDYTITRSIPEGGRFEARHREAGLHLWYTLTFDPELPLSKASSDLSSLLGVTCVDFVVPVIVQQTGSPFNDPNFSRQWHYYNDGSGTNRIAGADINLLPAWEITTGSPDVIVAVCDEGVQYTHPDLAGNVWVNEAEYNGTSGVDDDGNGYDDDIYGYNFEVDTYSAAIDFSTHGTHIAGTIAAVNNNAVGVNGIAGGDNSEGNGVRIMSTQIGPESSYIQLAFVYAADNGAVLMNCSWELSTSTTPSYIAEAIRYFNNYAGIDENGNQTGPMAGGLAIFAAGNSSTTASAPAMEDYVLAVSAIGANYAKTSYSNYGSWVDISAPGGDATNYIYSTSQNSGYTGMYGTSMACPHVTGVAALVVSKFGGEGFTREHLINILTSTANPVIYEYNTGYSGLLGSGLVDAYAALTVSENAPAAVTDLVGAVSENTINLSWTAPADAEGLTPFGYTVYWSTSPLDNISTDNLPSYVNSTSYTPDGTVSEGETLSYSLTDLNYGAGYYVRVASQNVFGVKSELSNQLYFETSSKNAPEITALDGTSLTLASHESGSLRFTAYDPDGDSMSYSIVATGSTGSLSGASGRLSDGVFTVTVNALQATDGVTYYGKLVVSDDLYSTEMAFSYTILENNAPVASACDNVVLNSNSDTQTVDLTEIFSDADGESLSYTVSTSVAGVVSTGISGGVLTLTATTYGTTDVSVTATDARGESASCTFSVLVRDGSNEVDLYPNPVSSVLNIRTATTVSADISISNRTGATVYSQSQATIDPFAPVQVDMSALPAGVYYVSISGGQLNSTSSVTKQ